MIGISRRLGTESGQVQDMRYRLVEKNINYFSMTHLKRHQILLIGQEKEKQQLPCALPGVSFTHLNHAFKAHLQKDGNFKQVLSV